MADGAARYEVGYGPCWPTWYVWDNRADPPACGSLDPETTVARLNEADALRQDVARLTAERDEARAELASAIYVLERSQRSFPHNLGWADDARALIELYADIPQTEAGNAS